MVSERLMFIKGFRLLISRRIIWKDLDQADEAEIAEAAVEAEAEALEAEAAVEVVEEVSVEEAAVEAEAEALEAEAADSEEIQDQEKCIK
jgi:hypothetical protein